MGVPNRPEPTGHRDGVFGLWERAGALLLARNARVQGGRSVSFWDLPGGAVRSGETLEEALVREWDEEVGLVARVGELVQVVDGVKRRSPSKPPLYTWRGFFFRVESRGEPVAGPGIDAVAWVPRATAAARLAAPYHAPLRRFLEEGAAAYERVEWIDPLPEGDVAAAGLADRSRHLLAIAASAAAGAADLVQAQTRAACAEGVEPAVIAETLLQIVPYAGFPRTIAAFTAADPVIRLASDARRDASREVEEVGRATFDAVYGDTAKRVREGLAALDPHLAAWTERFAYGTVLSRTGTGLTLCERELLAVGILTALGRLEAPLLGHMRAALRLGATPDDVRSAVLCVPHALGEARRDAALQLLGRL